MAQVGGNPQGQALQADNRLRQLQQFEQDTRLQANPDVPPGERAFIDYGGYFSFNYLSLQDSTYDTHGLRQYELVGFARINLDGAQEIFLRGRTDYNDYNPGDSFDGFGSRLINPDLDRAYYRFDLRRYEQAYGKGDGGFGNLNLVAEVGRDLNYWANGLVLTEVLDGAHLTLGNDFLTMEAIVGITPTRTVDIDPTRPSFNDDTRRGFYGLMLTANVGEQRPFFYFLNQRDMNNFTSEMTGPIDTHFRYNSYYVGAGSTGPLSDQLHYSVEAVYEGGNTLSSSFINGGFGPIPVLQTEDTIEAWAADAKLDYVVPGAHQTRLSGELILASGDPDRGLTNTTFNGNKPDTKDHAFNAFGLLNTGLAFNAATSNLIVTRFGASTFPLPDSSRFRRLQLGMDFFILGKLRRAPD